ncbi:MAG: DUF2330 domain-containing protein [Armatimonadetes bacterium]|nr:DUF2330 domain-containing protein [Armatimonadota bacterium]
MRLRSAVVLITIPMMSVVPARASGLLVPSESAWGETKPVVPRLPVHRAIIYRPDADSQVLLLQPSYHGPLKEFCWIIPVPERPGPDDVFLASQEFIDAVFEHTAPLVSTEIMDSGSSGDVRDDGADAITGVPYYSAARASDWLATGDYRIDRPNRRNCERLAEWLGWAGYQVPPGFETAIKRYLDRDWRFVVVKVYPQADSEKRVSARLRPLGIRFATRGPIYPLALSRLGAPQVTALEIVVLGTTPVVVASWAAADLTRQVTLEPGESYEDYRAREAQGKLAREAVVRGACEYSDLHYETRRWMGVRDPRWAKLWATRFFGLLPPARLADLSFVADPKGAAFRVHVARTRDLAATQSRQRPGAARARSLIPLLILLAAGLLLWGAGLTADQSSAREKHGNEPSAVGYVGRLLVYCGAVLLLPAVFHALGGSLDSLRPVRLFVSGQLPLLSTCWWGALLLAWSLACIIFVVRNRRGQARGRWLFALTASVVWAALAVTVVFAPSPAMREASRLGSTESLAIAQSTALLAITALAALAGALLQLGLAGSLRGQVVCAEFLVIALVWTLLTPRVGVSTQSQAQVEERAGSLKTALDEELSLLREAIVDFASSYGCFPKSLEALTRSTAPKSGIDEAGNTVESNTTRGASRRFLARIPADPLDSNTADWLYSPLRPDFVESSAFRVHVSAPTRGAASEPVLRRHWELPRAAGVREALGPIASMIWGEGDALFRMDAEADGTPVARAVAVRLLKGAVVAVHDVPGITSPRLSSIPGSTNMVLACAVRRGSEGISTARGVSDSTAVFEVTSAGHHIGVMGPPVRGRVTQLEAAPDGVRVACILERPGPSGKPVRQLWSLGDRGEWLGPLAEDVARVAWHPSGMPLFALVRTAGNTGVGAASNCRLVQIWPDGQTDTLTPELRFRDTVLAANIRSVFALDTTNKLRMIPLRRGSVRTLETGGGRVMDFHCLSGERTATLLINSHSSKERKTAERLLIHDMRGRSAADLSPVAPPGVKWRHGLVIGQHDATGYLFLHLWQDEPASGEIVLLGEDGTPPQGIAMFGE